MIEATLVFLTWLKARIKTGEPVYVSIRDAYILYVAWSCLLGMLIFGGVFYAIETSAGSRVLYVDCLFHVASAMSSTGLITLDTSLLQPGSLVIIFFSIVIFANTLIVTQVPVVLRILRVRVAISHMDSSAAALEAQRAQLRDLYHLSEEALANGASVGSTGSQLVQLVANGLDGNDSDVGTTVRLKQRARRLGRAQISISKSVFVERFGVESSTGHATREGSVSGGVAFHALSMGGGKGAVGLGILGKRGSSSGGSASEVNVSVNKTVGAKFAASIAASIAALTQRDLPPAAAAALIDYRDALAAHVNAGHALAEYLVGHDYLGSHWCFGLACAYYFLVCFAGFIIFYAWGAGSAAARAILDRNGLGGDNLPWFALFHSFALFTNTGMIMVADNMVQFRHESFFVIASGVIALLGFSLYPLGFRLFVMSAHAGIPKKWAKSKAAVRDLLDHPRKYTTHLFSSNGTRALVLMSVATQASLFFVYLVFDFRSHYFQEMFPVSGQNAMNGWFSSTSEWRARGSGRGPSFRGRMPGSCFLLATRSWSDARSRAQRVIVDCRPLPVLGLALAYAAPPPPQWSTMPVLTHSIYP